MAWTWDWYTHAELATDQPHVAYKESNKREGKFMGSMTSIYDLEYKLWNLYIYILLIVSVHS